MIWHFYEFVISYFYFLRLCFQRILCSVMQCGVSFMQWNNVPIFTECRYVWCMEWNEKEMKIAKCFCRITPFSNVDVCFVFLQSAQSVDLLSIQSACGLLIYMEYVICVCFSLNIYWFFRIAEYTVLTSNWTCSKYSTVSSQKLYQILNGQPLMRSHATITL